MNKFVGGAFAGSVAFWLLPTLPALLLTAGMGVYLVAKAKGE